MDTTILTNVLFAILSLFLIFTVTIFAILTLYIIKIAKSAHSILETIKRGSEKIKSGEALIVSSIAHAISFFKDHRKKSKK